MPGFFRQYLSDIRSAAREAEQRDAVTRRQAEADRQLQLALDPDHVRASVGLPDEDEWSPMVRTAYALCTVIVGELQVTDQTLRQLSFYAREDSLLLAETARKTAECAATLGRVDEALRKATLGSEGADNLLVPLSDGKLTVGSAATRQSLLEHSFAGRDGPDGEWLRRTLAVRRQLIETLSGAYEETVRMHQRAVWMCSRQHERGADDELELLDDSQLHETVSESTRLIAALTDAVGEVHLGTISRL